MTVFLTTLGLIGAAEMGDKTQLLTLALAARLPLGAVLGGVVVATLLNHALAVAVGGAALLVVPASVLRAAAGLSFIGFGLWTLRGDQLAGNEERRVGPPLVTVAVSFFLAEMGDKTQLAAALHNAGAPHSREDRPGPDHGRSPTRSPRVAGGQASQTHRTVGFGRGLPL